MQGAGDDISHNGYDSQRRAEHTASRRVDDHTINAVIFVNATATDVVLVRVIKGKIDPFRRQLGKLFQGQWEVVDA